MYIGCHAFPTLICLLPQDLKWCIGVFDKIPVLRPRIGHLQAYFFMLNGQKSPALKTVKQAMKFTSKQENSHEEQWMKHNRESWSKKPFDDKCNHMWKSFTDSAFLDWQLRSGLTGNFNIYTLPLPCSN